MAEPCPYLFYVLTQKNRGQRVLSRSQRTYCGLPYRQNRGTKRRLAQALKRNTFILFFHCTVRSANGATGSNGSSCPCSRIMFLCEYPPRGHRGHRFCKPVESCSLLVWRVAELLSRTIRSRTSKQLWISECRSSRMLSLTSARESESAVAL